MEEKILFNAQIITMDPRLPQADSMVINTDGTITAIGHYDTLKNDFPKAEPLDLAQKVILPGFNDSHIHVWKIGHLRTSMLDLRGTQSIASFQQQVADFALANPGNTWILARGINEATLLEKKLPTKEVIDEVVPDRPVWVIRTCAHIAIANSRALQLAHVNNDTPVPFGGEVKKHADGSLNGIFTERALGLVANSIPMPSIADYEKMILEAQEYLISLGITSATDPGVDPTLLQAYRNLDQKGLLKMRLNVFALRIPDGSEQVLPLPELYQSPHLQISTVKFFADGGLSSATAALNVAYKNTNNYKGILRLEHKLFLQAATEAVSKGFKVATHAIGHQAIDLCLDIYQKLHEVNPLLHHRIEHLGFLESKNIARFRDLNIGVAMQPIFIDELATNFLASLNEEALKQLYPCRSVLDIGIRLGLSTDGPVVRDINPFINVFAAITRRSRTGIILGKDQKISLFEALNAYTCGSAQLDQQQQKKGKLSVGNVADFVIIDQNPYSCSNLKEIQILQTWIDGRLTWQRFRKIKNHPESIIKQI